MPYLVNSFGSEKIRLSQLDVYLSKNHKDRIVSSYGIGPNVNYTHKGWDGFDRTNYGASLFINLLGDKLRLTLGTRSVDKTVNRSTGRFPGEDTYATIGITDVPSLLYWIIQAYVK
jgi:hypothetical protein